MEMSGHARDPLKGGLTKLSAATHQKEVVIIRPARKSNSEARVFVCFLAGFLAQS